MLVFKILISVCVDRTLVDTELQTKPTVTVHARGMPVKSVGEAGKIVYIQQVIIIWFPF